jgi:hypothetical protein
MWKSGFTLIAAMPLTFAASVLPVFAQSDSAAPPKLEKLEEIKPAPRAPIAVRPPASSGPQITQTREQGVVTEVQVKSGNNTYYVKPNAPGTNAQSDAATRPAQWQIMQFDLKRSEERKTTAAEAASVPAPPETQSAPAKK